MSDYIPKDPLGPNGGPNDPNRYGYDRYGNTRFEPANDSGKGPYILLGLLVAIGLVGGLLYFNGTPKGGDNVAQAPAIERTTPLPTPPAAVPVTPMTPTAPAPTTAPAAPAQAPAGTHQ